MHHKKFFLIIILIVCFCSIIGCGSPGDNTVSKVYVETETSAESIVETGNQVIAQKAETLTEGYEVVEKVAVFEEYALPTIDIAKKYWETDEISGVDTTYVVYNGEYIFAVLSCYSREMLLHPDLGDLVIKYDVITGETELITKLLPEDCIRKLIYCANNLFWTTYTDDWKIYRYNISREEISILAQADVGADYTGSTALTAKDEYIIYSEYIGKSEIKMHFYSVLNDTEICFNQNDLSVNSPYWLPDVEGNTALAIRSKYSYAKVALLNLETGKRGDDIKLPDGFGYGFLDESGYIMFSNDYSYNNIWLYELETGKSEKLYSAGEDVFKLRKWNGEFLLYRPYSESPKMELFNTKEKTHIIYEVPEQLGLISICGEYLLFYNGRYVSIFKE